jgi:anaerobic ribonucleoside-triphosphate reductase
MSTFLLQKDKETGEPLYDLDRTTMTLGFCGLYECLNILEDISGEEIIDFINDKKQEFYERDGLR